jgi:hypothetical protein
MGESDSVVALGTPDIHKHLDAIRDPPVEHAMQLGFIDPHELGHQVKRDALLSGWVLDPSERAVPDTSSVEPDILVSRRSNHGELISLPPAVDQA